MSAVVDLQNVTKQYGNFIALANVSLEVPPGVVFALLGDVRLIETTEQFPDNGEPSPDGKEPQLPVAID